MSGPLTTPPHDALRDQAVDILRQLQAHGVTPRGVSADSRRVRAGDVFLAYPGHQADGRDFIAAAAARGAVAVLFEAKGQKLGTPGVLPAGRADETTALQGGRAKDALLAVADGDTP